MHNQRKEFPLGRHTAAPTPAHLRHGVSLAQRDGAVTLHRLEVHRHGERHADLVRARVALANGVACGSHWEIGTHKGLQLRGKVSPLAPILGCQGTRGTHGTKPHWALATDPACGHAAAHACSIARTGTPMSHKPTTKTYTLIIRPTLMSPTVRAVPAGMATDV